MEPHVDGVVLETMDDTIRYLSRLYVMADSVPVLANRSTHLAALSAGVEGLMEMVPVLRPHDDPPEEEG